MRLQIGATAEMKKVVTKADILAFNKATGHEGAPQKDSGGRLMVQSMFAAGVIAQLLENEIPGERNVYLSQSLKFKKPIYEGDSLTANVIISYYRDAELMFSTKCFNQNNDLVLEGDALILLSEDAAESPA